MTPYPDAMKNIAQQWLPFGGPPAEEVLVRSVSLSKLFIGG